MTEPTTTKLALLVVDDSRLMRIAARKILKNDFEVIDAEDGEVAWDILQDNQQIALVISDLSMPNLDGLGLLNKIRISRHAHLRDLPVIIVTGAEDDDGSKATALAAGASDFITKPFESVELLARTKAQARQQRMQQALDRSEATRQVLEEHTSLDPTTKLPNKAAFMNSVEEHLAYAIRHRTELSLLILRIDRYKILFLRRGKQAAEEVVRRFAAIARQARRREDIVARTGLDTLALLLPSSNSIASARICDQLRDAIAQQDFSDLGIQPVVNVSLGLSSLPVHRDLKAMDLLEDAMKSLGNAKHATAPSSQDPVTPDRQAPTASIDPVVASAHEIYRALQDLANGAGPTQPADQLVRAVLPVLELWNKNNNDRHRALIDALLSALDADPHSATESTRLPEASNKSP